jgi:HlyD family secretion protein
MKRLLWTVVILAVIGGGVWFFLPSRGAAQARSPFAIATVTRGDIVQVVTVTGQVNPVVNVQVGSQISGLIKELLADFNSTVTEGQVIAKLDDSTFRAALMSAEGNLAQARASLQLARIQFERNRELRESLSITQNVLDQSEADLLRAEAQVRIAEASVERARIDLERCTIYSPVSGLVISRAVDVGQTVAASLNAPVLFTIAADLSKMQIIANVAEADIGLIRNGQRVLFTVDAFPGRPFFGSVSQIRNAPRTVDNVVTYDTVIEVFNPDLLLKPGMTANVQIVVAERNNVVRIPNNALRVRLSEDQFIAPQPLPENPARMEASAPSSAAGDATGEGPAGGEGMRRRRPEGGGGAAAEAPAALMRSFRERSSSRTVRTAFIVSSSAPPASELAQAVQVRIGITDGQFTEVLSGIDEGAFIVTGLVPASNTRAAAQNQPQRPALPFGR